MEPRGFVCGPRIYKFNGWVFDYGHTGCWPLKKDLEPRKRAGRKFYSDLSEFFDLDKVGKEEYRIGGGCRAF